VDVPADVVDLSTGGLLLSVPHAEHYLGDLTGFAARVDELVKQYRPACITFDSYGGMLLEHLQARYPGICEQSSSRDAVLLSGLQTVREYMTAGRFALSADDAACLADDLDYIGLDGDTVTIGTYQRTYWHDGASVERPVHADAAKALLQGIGKAVERLTRAATAGHVAVHGAPRAPEPKHVQDIRKRTEQRRPNYSYQR
jgi:hypothetical protein